MSAHPSMLEVQRQLEQMRKARLARERISCAHCAKPFQKNRPWQRFCSDECRLTANQSVTRRQYAELEKENAELMAEILVLRAEVARLKS